MLFATYSSLIGESQGTSNYRTRLSQIVKWCGSDFDGVVSLLIVELSDLFTMLDFRSRRQ